MCTKQQTATLRLLLAFDVSGFKHEGRENTKLEHFLPSLSTESIQMFNISTERVINDKHQLTIQGKYKAYSVLKSTNSRTLHKSNSINKEIRQAK